MQFQRLLLLFVASNSGKKYWDWTLPRIRAQIELSSTFVYDYKMSTSGSSAKNSHLTQGGRTTMMPMPVDWITSQCKIKVLYKYCRLWNFCHSFLQWMGSLFLIIMFCSAIKHAIHCHSSPPGWEANSSQTAVHAYFLVVNKGAGQFYLGFKILWKSYLQSINSISDEFQHSL